MIALSVSGIVFAGALARAAWRSLFGLDINDLDKLRVLCDETTADYSELRSESYQ
jgi:hypothetical protein